MVLASQEKTVSIQTLSALQLRRGVSRGEMTYLAAIYKVSEKGLEEESLPMEIKAYFTKLNLRSRYYQVRITEGDEKMTTYMSRYGAYEFLVIPLGLTNIPATFCTLTNKMFHPYLDRFVVVYHDDIVVYNNTLEEHIEHLRTVFQVLRENQLFLKKEKCMFVKEEVHFLGHWPLDKPGPNSHGPAEGSSYFRM
uniref:Reverse transcriptase domain-containing protein n=1 Tax=Ananas comosus var. bracteatus TaxID=296719 RepID=A0A6V7QHD2_ANACO|nr:unnamed protein product [Ananas comosus var. bracteatus]